MEFKYWKMKNRSMVLIARFKHVCRYARALEAIINIQEQTINALRKQVVFDMHMLKTLNINDEIVGELRYKISEGLIFDDVMEDKQDWDG